MSRLAYYICSYDKTSSPREPHHGYCEPIHEEPIYLETYAADIVADTLSGNLALTRVIDMPLEKLPEEDKD